MITLDVYLEEFKKEYGNRKYQKIKKDIIYSKHTKKLVDESFQLNIVPTGQDFVTCVFSNFKYGFASVDVVLAASITLLSIWKQHCYKHGRPVRDSDLERITKNIALICREMRF